MRSANGLMMTPSSWPPDHEDFHLLFVDFVVRSLVDHPDSVQVSTETNDRTTLIKVTCEKQDIGKIIGADYSSKVLKRELKEIFGTTKLGSLQKKVAITAFDLDNEAGRKRTWKPKIFHNYSGAGSDGRYSAAKVALYTSAAPTYFPSVEGYIDGGVFANNPSMVALVQAISKDNKPQERAQLDDVVLLSIGTGISLKYIKEKKLDWGYAQWAQPMLEVLMDGVAGISDYQCQQILDERYLRLQVTFATNEKIDMDNVKKIPRMDEIGRGHDVRATRDWIQEHWL